MLFNCARAGAMQLAAMVYLPNFIAILRVRVFAAALLIPQVICLVQACNEFVGRLVILPQSPRRPMNSQDISNVPRC
ncbi:MAG: hypothetical protein LBJ95_01125 [Oscillospiraceae bacterium]|nr:hypothetical protein [Oscillospiraceae bacterium]